MPSIQYKIVDGYPLVMGIHEAATLVEKEFLKHKRLILNGETITDFETILKIRGEDMYVDDDLHLYKLKSIWLALNQKNHELYLKNQLNLNKIMIGNILSNFKDLNIFIQKKIMLKGNFFPTEATVKNKTMLGFKGEFITNVKLPNYMGLGKRKSVGFGTVKNRDGKEEIF